MPIDAPDQLKRYLKEIADQLWSGNAAVMVGAGFSRNAKPAGPTSASFPSWQELGDRFFEKLHRERPPSTEDRYLSILKLAEKVEATFGRPTLDQLLRDAIPNLRYEPSPLHSQLLNLPWKDVFTTNYDTLLERARASVTLKHYDVVTTKDDLLYANQPRIVKLHGSFPSPPFVITEEDYRRYPSVHAPFVNTIRQSLLENTLCLVGFSGDDPNFLQWIGWIRDHIGKETASKIYLIGMFNRLDEGDKKLLDRRGIVVVDLSTFNTDTGEALDKFLKLLKEGSEERKKRTVDWPTVLADVKEMMISRDPNKYHEVVVEWRRQRGEYPGWVVVPEDRRRSLWCYTGHLLSLVSKMSSEDRGQLETPLDLDLAFELAWRLDRCLFPLIGELPSFLEDMASKYSGNTLLLPENSHWTRPSSVFGAVVNIRLWLLRYYREQGLNDKWQTVRETIQNDLEKLLPEHKARFHLEEVLQALFCFDPDEAKRLLDNWQSNDNLPFWEAKRAALMAELGEVEAAHSIVQKSLSSIRRQLSLNPVVEDYTLISQESIIMLLLRAIEKSKSTYNNTTKSARKKSEELAYEETKISERLDDLARYKCDPRREIEFLSAHLKHPAVNSRPTSTTHHFDLGIVSQILHSGFDNEAVMAYQTLRMYEDIGMPYRIKSVTFNKAEIEATLPRIRPYSPHWALAIIARLGEASAIDKLFDREYLSNLRSEDVDRLFDIYLPAFKRTIAMAGEADSSRANNFKLLAEILPDVLGRLCCKCSRQYRQHLVIELRKIYSSARKQMFPKVGQFARSLFGSMSDQERVSTVPLLIYFPVPNLLNDWQRWDFINPVSYIDLPASLPKNAFYVTETRVNQLLAQLAADNQDRDWAMTSLTFLHQHGKLNQHQSDCLEGLLQGSLGAGKAWELVYSFASIRLPAKNYLLSSLTHHTQNAIDSKLKGTLDELYQSAGVAQWTNTEAVELVNVLFTWWEEHMNTLRQRTLTLGGRPIDTVRQAICTLSEVFSYLSADSNDEGFSLLTEFRNTLSSQGIPAKVLDAVTLSEVHQSRQTVLGEVAKALLDNDKDIVLDALWAVTILVRQFAEEEPPLEFAPVAAMLVQGIQWRHRPQLSVRLGVVADLVEKQHWFLSLVEVTDLLAGLEQIAEETSRGIRGNDEDGVITIRAEAARLAFVLSKYYQEHGSSEPEVIERWQELCTDSEEFSEVKNAWSDIDI